jgi:OOP family OmpA-OmpF porin
MRSRALLVVVLGLLGASLAACATPQDKAACYPLSSWSAPAFRCGGGGGAAPQVAMTPPPAPTPPPEPVKPPEPEPEPQPPPPTAALKANMIELSEMVQFETDSARLVDRSKQLLDDVARELSDHPEFKRVVVENYTEVGKKHNMKLSQQRAAAVKSYLVSKGVAGKRVTVKAFGDTKGRGKNPRVEFRVFKK